MQFSLQHGKLSPWFSAGGAQSAEETFLPSKRLFCVGLGMPAACVLSAPPSQHKQHQWGSGTEIQQGLAEVPTQAENKLAAAALLFSKLAVPGMGPALFPSLGDTHCFSREISEGTWGNEIGLWV